jgi:hypothetical protein
MIGIYYNLLIIIGQPPISWLPLLSASGIVIRDLCTELPAIKPSSMSEADVFSETKILDY